MLFLLDLFVGNAGTVGAELETDLLQILAKLLIPK
jgi:hypothetical protein